MPQSTTLLRYRYPDGRIQAALPLRIIESTPDVVVGWLPSGSEIAYWALDDGGDPRTVPLQSRFHHRLGTARRNWNGGSVLRVIPIAQPWQVLHFWDAEGAFAGWYVNLESTKRRDQLGLVAVDWHLDLVISPDFEVQWKDEDEAAAALETEYLREEDLALARRTGESIAANARKFIDALGRWDLFRPPETFEQPLSLPPGWEVP